MARTRIAMVAALCAALTAVALAAPAPSVASGDDHHTLTNERTQLSQSLASSHDDLDEISGRLLGAQDELADAAASLSAARSRLSGLQVDVQLATERDAQLQRALAAALQRLSNAKADLAQGRTTVAHQRDTLAGYAVTTAQSEVTQLSTLGLVVTAGSTHAAIEQVQGSGSALARQLTDLQRLQANQVLLRYTEQRVQQATSQVAADRAAAAATLATTQQLESAAAGAASSVQQKVASLQRQRDDLARAKSSELVRIQTMVRERSRLEAQLRRIAEQRAAAQRASASAGTTSSDGGFLSYPVHDTYVTSPFGMRLHPILHIWELHDGTDFHAVCGTPVYAAADGRVTSEYFNTGYGNRLIVDHGFVKGVSLWTSYNHLTSYVASVGEQVDRGQLIGYSGTTGYSTGCHLHFMVYVNGIAVNPMGWL